MFVGHYGPSFAIKSIQRPIRLWVLFIAVQLLDVGWSVLVFLDVEKVRIVPWITASNPLDLYYMPYTHSPVAAFAWAVAGIILCRILLGIRDWSAGVLVGAAVFSHWVLDFLVHRRDLPLYDDAVSRPLCADWILMWNVSKSAGLAEVEKLLQLGVDQDLRTEDGETALSMAENLGLVKIVARLRTAYLLTD